MESIGTDPMGSDHLPILIQMKTPKSNYSTRYYNPRVIKRNYKQANWTLYTETINNMLDT